MRLSTVVGDPGYVNHVPGGGVVILLDGEICGGARTVDEALGFVDVVKRSQDGDVVLNGDVLCTERRRGAVEIVPPPGYTREEFERAVAMQRGRG